MGKNFIHLKMSPTLKKTKGQFCMNLPQVVQENDNDIRIFMPKVGTM